MSILAKIVSSKVRAELLRLLFGTRSSELHMRELQREAGCSIAPIQAELRKLCDLQLVLARRSGNRVYYKANMQHPLYREIHMLVLKTSGLTDYLTEMLKTRDDIELAFVFGSLAAGSEQAASDIDLMFIGTVGLRAVSGMLSTFKGTIGREVNPHVFTREEFMKRKQQGEHFITSVLASPRIFVKGTERDLAEMV